MKIISGILVISAISLLCACGNSADMNKVEDRDSLAAKPLEINVSGNYVDGGYAQRSEGADWISVSVETKNTDSIYVSVRSRADIKKPTCTYDAGAKKLDDSTYVTLQNTEEIFFRFGNNSVNISTRNAESGVLNFYCSGGATVAGTYTKIDGDLEEVQIDKK